MTTGKDWVRWHASYSDEGSALSRRLRVVRSCIDDWLGARAEPELQVVSACAGQGFDLIGVLEGRADAGRVRGRLIEFDERNVEAAREHIARAGLSGLTVVRADAGELAAYAGAVPADLVLMAGVFGNISDADIQATVTALPQLCAEDATVIWTRSRRKPDLTPAIRDWFGDAGFDEVAFHAPDDVLFSVGVHHFRGKPQPLTPTATIFRFVV